MNHLQCCGIILLLLLFMVDSSSFADQNAVDKTSMCNEKKLDPKKVNKLQKLIEQEEQLKNARIQETTNEWQMPGDKTLNEEMHNFMNIPANPNCAYSLKSDRKFYQECKTFDREQFRQQQSIIAGFTNGRLGNQMSSYATIFAIAKTMDMTPVMTQTQFNILQPFFPNLSEDLILEKMYCHHCDLPWQMKNLRLFRIAKNKNATFVKGKAITIPAYSNDPLLYKDVIGELRQEFDLASKYKDLAKERIESYLKQFGIERREDVVLVAVHFRGTDYAGILLTMENKRISSKYYNKAFELIASKLPEGSRIMFLVVTDHPEMAKRIIKDDPKSKWYDNIIVAGSAEDILSNSSTLSAIDSLGLDLGIFTQSDHAIVSYSTLGIWAGHLSNGMTVMSRGFAPHEDECFKANFENWHFFYEDEKEN